MDYWKIAAFIGAILFLISGFLPMISLSLFDTSNSFSLFNVYASMTQSGSSTAGEVTVNAATIGILLTIILYPIAVILGFVSIAKRKLAIAAGILGLICWIGTIVALSTFNATQYTGIGVYIGIVGAVVIAAAYFMKPSTHATQAVAPPPPPPQYATSR